MLQPGATPGDEGGVPGEVTEVAIVLLQLKVGRNSNGPVGKWVEFHHYRAANPPGRGSPRREVTPSFMTTVAAD
jgi:hypothetical protein